MNPSCFTENNMETIGKKMRQLLLPFLLFLATFSAIISTIDDYGLVWDERFTIENARTIESWFVNAAHSSSYFNYDTINTFWNSERRDDYTGDAHPPFIKLSAIFFRHVVGSVLFDNIVYQYRVSTAFWTAILVVMLYLVIKKFTQSALWGVLGGLSFISVPRFFADAHFYTTDMIVSALGFSGLSVFMFSSRPWIRIMCGGALFGAALAAKFTGILAFAIVVPMIIIAENRKRFIREFAFMGVVAAFFFSLFNFPLLFNPYREISMYFRLYLNRGKMLPISTLYFGNSENFTLPFHEPWVMFGITLPELLVITAGIGMLGSAFLYLKNQDAFSYFALVPLLLLMSIYMLPSTPKHDGIRLFSSSWPFIILLCIAGCYQLQRLFSEKFRVGVIVCIASIFLSGKELRASHPYQLSYYNGFIGGSKGAQQKGFAISYWYEAFNRDFFRKLSQITNNENVGIYSYPDVEIVQWNQRYGLLTTELQSMPEDGEYKYILILNRILTPAMNAYLAQCKPLLKLETRDGAFIGGLFQNK